MINLLPADLKQTYRYAHHNVKLVRWICIFVLGFAGLAIIGSLGVASISQTVDTYNKQIATDQKVLKQQKLSQTQKEVQEISGNLKLAVRVLSKEVLFSKLLEQLAAITPSNVILTDLSISQTQGALDITAEASNYTAATQLQVNLADPANKIFSKADIINTSCKSGVDATKTQYPCTISITALFANNNPFLFINSQNGASNE